MMRIDADTLSSMQQVHDRYVNLISDLDSTTDQLMQTIRDADMAALSGLLDKRERLCSQFEPSLTGIAQLILTLNALPDTPEMRLNPALVELRKSIAGLNERHQTFLSRQTDCQQMLRDKVGETRSQLITLNRHAGANLAYNYRSNTQAAIYLDNRL